MTCTEKEKAYDNGGRDQSKASSHQKLEEARDGEFPGASEGNTDLQYFDLGPLILNLGILEFWPPEL